MNTIKMLVQSRIRYNRSRTILTAAAVMLTTTLLMGAGTSVTGILDINRQQAKAAGNSHAALKMLTEEQLHILQNHNDVEAVEANEIFASVEYGKMDGFLTYRKSLKDGIYHGLGNLIEGRKAQEADEICGPKAFFERMGVEPVVGNRITISFRPEGKGRIETREFIICGIVSQADISELPVNDTRAVYGAEISEALIEEYIPEDECIYTAEIRVKGEERLNYDEVKDIVMDTASDVGCDEKNVSLNSEYLIVMTDMGTETMAITAGISFLIILFSGLVIYSIYYVGVITDVQEIGKLKALGASDRQLKHMLLTEGFGISLFAVPCGLLFGFLIPYFTLPAVVNRVSEMTVSTQKMERIHMFSLPALLLVAAAVFLTVYISLLKPMRMAAKVSPAEAVRYQEGSGRKKQRKGYKNMNVFRLGIANLVRNRKRTIVTMLTMGLSCVLFMSLAGTINSMSAEDLARRNIETGDFRLSLRYSINDEEYPQNNLDSLSVKNLFGSAFMESIQRIEGIKDVERKGCVLFGTDYPSEWFENGGRSSLSWFDREDVGRLEEDKIAGSIDYDVMAAENGVIFTDVFYEEANIRPGDVIPAIIYDGSDTFLTNLKVAAIALDEGDSSFMLPKEAYDRLGLKYDSTTDVYLSVDENKYDEVKTTLAKITDAEEYFEMYSMDEELVIGRMSVAMIKYPLYVVLVMVAVISFTNLVNTMITSVVTRKHELGILQAIGLSERQLVKMLSGEGMVFTAGTLLASVSIGNLAGYLIFLWAKKSHFMSITRYHYPLLETLGLAVLLAAGQCFITYYIRKRLGKVSLIDTIRGNE